MGEKTEIRKSRMIAKKIVAFACMMFGIIILSVAATIFTQTNDASAAKKKAKQVDEYVTMSLKNGVLTVKGNGEMGDPVNITVYEGKNIKKAVVKKGVVSLPDNAFKDCKKLKKVILPSTLKRIGVRAFANTPALKSLTLPEGVKVIKEDTFEKSGIEKINIPKTVKSIEIRAFAGSAIKSITIPKTVKKLGELAFDGCEKLENITMPGNIGVIKVVYDDGNDYVPSPFIWNMGKSLKKVKFTTALNLDILKRIGKTENFEVAANDPKYKSVDGMIYSKDEKTLIRIPLGRKKVVIPESCTTVTAGSYGYAIGDDIYGVESTMSEIVFSKTVTKIISDGTSVDLGHYECKDIKITLNMDYLDNESIQQLWASNVCWEKSLKNELMRKGLAKLNEENERMLMLSDGYLCGYLTEDENDINKIEKHETINGLVVPDNVKTIGSKAFGGYYICSITLGSSVERVESTAFGWLQGGWRDDSLKTYAIIYIKNNNIQIAQDAFNIGDYVNVIMI